MASTPSSTPTPAPPTAPEPLEIRLSEFILAPVDVVWRHVATEEGMRAWQSAARFDPRVGGEALFYLDANARRSTEADAHYVMTGRVLEIDEPRRLVYTWRQHERPTGETWPDETTIEITLRPEGDGTRVDVRHHGFERLGAIGPAFRDGYERGWNAHDSLPMLKERIEARAGAA